MIVVSPIPVTADLIGAACSLAEDPTSAWTSGTYAVGDERHVVSTHRVYRCAVAGSRTISPELDPTNWKDMRPTNRMAPFDYYVSTDAESTAVDIVYPITARFVDSIALYGLEGGGYEIIVKDTAGGAVIDTRSGPLNVRGAGWYNYFFDRARVIDRLLITNLPIRPAAEITIKINGAAGSRRAVGMIAMGRLKNVSGDSSFGGTQRGATTEPFTNSYIKAQDDGTLSIVRRNSGTNLRGTVILARENADQAVRFLKSLLDVPVAVMATDAAGFDGLNTFGLISSSPVRYEGATLAYIDYSIKGIV